MMNRKNFLSSLIGISTALPLLDSWNVPDSLAEISAIIPPKLKPGDIVGISSPAGYITLEDIAPAIERLQFWGFRVKVGSTIGKKDFGFGGTDLERLEDMQQMLDDRSVKAVLCARGGYGAIRIIDKLKFPNFVKSPKWIIGFSDITVLHCHLNRNYGISSIHAKMCNSFPKDWKTADPIQQETINSIWKALVGEKTHYQWPASSFNRFGMGEGALVGGNLKTIETLAGSSSDLRTTNKILFVEDVGEYLYSIDRMFWNLKRSGKLKSLKGLIIGGFRVKEDDPGNEFGKTLEQIVLEKVKEYRYPVSFNFPVGHQKENYALKVGIIHRLRVNETGCELLEI